MGTQILNFLNDQESTVQTASLISLQEVLGRVVLKLKISPDNQDGSLLTNEEFAKKKNELTGQRKQLEGAIVKQGQQVDS